MFTWTSRFLLLFFIFGIFAPDYVRAQEPHYPLLPNIWDYEDSFYRETQEKIDELGEQQKNLLARMEWLDNSHSTEMIPLFEKFEDLEHPISDIDDFIQKMHQVAQKYEGTIYHLANAWSFAGMEEQKARCSLSEMQAARHGCARDATRIAETPGMQFRFSSELPVHSFMDIVPDARTLNTDDAFLEAMETANEDLDIWFLVEYMDPLYKQHYSPKTAYFASSILSSLFYQVNPDVQDTETQDNEVYKRLLLRLAARVNYRLNNFSAALDQEDEMMALGALRLLDVHIRNGLKNFGITNLYPDRWSSIKADLKRFKEEKPDESSTEFRSLLIAVEFATVYALITEQPDKLKEIVDLFETKPRETLFSGGWVPTDYKKHYTEVIAEMYTALYNSVQGNLVPEKSIKAIPNLLLGFAHPSHGTDTRVHAILAAGFLNKRADFYYKDEIRIPMEKAVRQRLVEYAGFIFRKINGCQDTLGLSSNEIKVLSDKLAAAVNNLLPITAPLTYWNSKYQNYWYDPNQKMEVTEIPATSTVTGHGSVKDKVFIPTGDGYATAMCIHNELNICAVNDEHRDAAARFMVEWILFDGILKIAGECFTVLAGGARFFAPSIRAASIAPAGSKITRFVTKLRQGTKYGTKYGFAAKIEKEGFIITNTKTVTAAAQKTAASGAKTAAKAGSKKLPAPATAQAQESAAATTQSLKKYEFTHLSKDGAVSGSVTAPGTPLGRAEARLAMQRYIQTAPVSAEEILQHGITNIPGILKNPTAEELKATITPEVVQQQRLVGGLSAKEIQSQYQFQTALKSIVESNPSMATSKLLPSELGYVSDEAGLNIINLDDVLYDFALQEAKGGEMTIEVVNKALDRFNASVLPLRNGTTMNYGLMDQATRDLFARHIRETSMFLDENAISSQLLTEELRQRSLMALDPNFNYAGTIISENAARNAALESSNLNLINTYDKLNQMGFQSAFLSKHPLITRFENIFQWAGGFILADMAAYGPSQQYVTYRANADVQKELDKAGVKRDGSQAVESTPPSVTPQDVHSAITAAEPQTFEGSLLMMPIVAIMSSHNKLVTDNQRALFRQLALQQKTASLTQTYAGMQVLKNAQNLINEVETAYTQGLQDFTLSAKQKGIQQDVLQWNAQKKAELETITQSEENWETKLKQINKWETEFLAQEREYSIRIFDAQILSQQALRELDRIETADFVLPKAAKERIDQSRAGIKRILQNEKFSEEQKKEKIINIYEQCLEELNEIFQQDTQPAVSSAASDELYDDAYNSDASSFAY